MKFLLTYGGTNYVLNEHENVIQYGSFVIPSEIMLYESHPESLVKPKLNPYWVIMLTSSSGTNYVPNEHEDDDQYDSYAIPSNIIPYQSYPKSLVSQNEILIELSC